MHKRDSLFLVYVMYTDNMMYTGYMVNNSLFIWTQDDIQMLKDTNGASKVPSVLTFSSWSSLRMFWRFQRAFFLSLKYVEKKHTHKNISSILLK